MDSIPTVFSERLFLNFEDQFRPFLAELDIPEAVFTRRDVEVSDVQYAELLETVARKTNPHIGLDMGERLIAQDLGVLGHAMAATATIGEALSVFSHYIYVFAQSNTIRLDRGGDMAVFTYTVTILQPELVRQDVEFALAFMIGLIRKLSGRKFRPKVVEFSHSQLTDDARHKSQLGGEVKFGRRANRVHFDKKVLEYPVLSADQGLLKALQFYLDDRLKVRSEEEDLLAKTRHLVSVSLSRGVPDLSKVASRLGMSKRTLQRKLEAKNVIFSDLVESVCKSVALEYVQHTDYHLTDVALMVGYSELSSFSRAFKRWTGSSPQQLRDGGKNLI